MYMISNECTVYIISVKKQKKTLENAEEQSKIDNPEKLVTQGTQDEENKSKNGHHYTQTNTNCLNKT